MAILPRNQKEESRIEIDLTGPDGNAFVLMGIASNLAKQLGIDPEMINKEMMLGDYEDLLQTMEHHFGEHIIMYR